MPLRWLGTSRADRQAVLTGAGLARLQRATPLHHDSVRRYLDQLPSVDLRALGTVLERKPLRGIPRPHPACE